MKIKGNLLERKFLVSHEGKKYYVSYVNADYPFHSLLNRDDWEVIDEDGEEVSIYTIKSVKNKRSKEETSLYYDLIEFCIKNFNSFELKTPQSKTS